MDLLREVRARWPRTLVVMITGFATIDTALEAMKLGAFDYLRKPFRMDQLRSTLEFVRQERTFRLPAEGGRDPAAEARSLAAAGHDVLYFGPEALPPVAHLEYARLDAGVPVTILDRIRAYLPEHPKLAVVIAGVERLLEHHRLEEVLETLEKARRLLEGHGPLRVAFDPGHVSPAEAVAVGGAVARAETQGTLEVLSNPIRRRVLERLSGGPATFGEVMAASGLDDSPKMSFHLHRLVDDGLVSHEGDVYRLSTRGEAALRLLTEATFLPPGGSGGNLAFVAERSKPRAG